MNNLSLVKKTAKTASAVLAVCVLSSQTFADDWIPLHQGTEQTTSVNKPVSAKAKRKPSATSGQNQLVAELLQRVEMLQQEMSELRELSDQQGNELEQLKRSQKQSYIDIDQRLSELYKRSKSTPVQPISPQPIAPIAKPVSDSATPKQAYKEAMAFVKAKKFDQAQKAFAEFTTRYPKHSLAANSWYWLGEVYLIQGQTGLAGDAFERVINDYPNHSKVADCLYKSALVAHKQGKIPVAKKRLQRVIDEYSGRAPVTVDLAKKYMERL